ncbi:MAG TPA: hypothetical protein PK250_14680 [Syntrophobacter fumaroxidans]|nr:hypothetical protein [Syntrophobacter fumaroxidans]
MPNLLSQLYPNTPRSHRETPLFRPSVRKKRLDHSRNAHRPKSRKSLKPSASPGKDDLLPKENKGPRFELFRTHRYGTVTGIDEDFLVRKELEELSHREKQPTRFAGEPG